MLEQSRSPNCTRMMSNAILRKTKRKLQYKYISILGTNLVVKPCSFWRKGTLGRVERRMNQRMIDSPNLTNFQYTLGDVVSVSSPNH